MKNTLLFLSLGLSLILSAACTKQDQKESSLLCDALGSEDLILAGQLIDDVAKFQSDPDWKVNVKAVEDWLTAHGCIEGALANYAIIETLPTQTEIWINAKLDGEYIIDLYFDETSGEIWFNRFHE